MKTLKERIDVEKAFLDGLEIEIESSRGNGSGEWLKLSPFQLNNYVFLWNHNDYRIKPEPMEFWVNIYEKDAGFNTEGEAKELGEQYSGYIKTIKVREVTE